MEQKMIPYFCHEGDMARAERTIKRLWILCILLVVLLVGTNIAWIHYENQWETAETVVTQDIDTVNGETRPTSRAIVTPAAVEEYFNVTSTAIITVPRGCCFNVSLRNVPASEDPTVTPAPVIDIQNANLIINRIA